jgi:hypothetical protein
MSNKAALSNYPLYTGDTTGFHIIANDSGETTTYIVAKDTLLSGLANTGSNSFVGNENINGNLSVTGSVVISGSLDITNANVGNSRFLFTQASGATTWSVVHNLGYSYPNVTIYDGSNNKVMIPADVISVDPNTTQVTFATPEYGYALVSMGGLSTTTSDAIIYSLQTTTSSLNTFTSSAITRLNSIEGVSGSYATTGSNLFKGSQTISGSIIPAVTNTYDLGSATNQFRHLYLSSASLYIDGTKVLGSTSQELQITTDVGQSFKILEAGSDNITLQSADGNIELKSSGGGDVILDPTTGVIALKGTTTLYAGNKILSSDGNAIQIGNSTTITGSLIVTGFIETQELRTTYISSSILYRSGSTKFGDELGDTHSFTGSLSISGSISVSGSGLISGSAQVDVMSTTNIARLATTGSNSFNGNQTISGGLVVTGSISSVGTGIVRSVIETTGGVQEPSLQFKTTLGSYYLGNYPNTNIFYFDNRTGYRTSFQVDGTEKVAIGATGNLSVTGSLTTTAAISINSTSTTQLNVYTSSVSTQNIMSEFYNGDYTTNTRNFIRVRNGINAGSTMSSYFGQGQDGKTYIIANDFTKNHIVIDGNSTYVGINKNTPNSQLDVNGNTTVTGSLVTTSNVTIGTTNSGQPTLYLTRVGGYPTIKGSTANGGDGQIVIDGASDTSNVYLNNYVASNVYLATGGGTTHSGKLIPHTNAIHDLGSTTNRWGTVYTSDLSMSNGIGDYTIVEGLEDLFLYNNKTNKVFKFMLQEVDPSTATPKKS